MEKCTDCSKFKTCKKMCPEVEAWVNQDYVPQREIVTEKISRFSVENGDTLGAWQSDKNPVHLTKREKQILRLLTQEFKKKEICQLLDIKSNVYDFHMCNLKKKAQKT